MYFEWFTLNPNSYKFRKHCSSIFYLMNIQSRRGDISWTFYIMVCIMIFLFVSYCVKVVAIPLHTLHICTHQNYDVWSVSRCGAHKPLGFLAPFAIKSYSTLRQIMASNTKINTMPSSNLQEFWWMHKMHASAHFLCKIYWLFALTRSAPGV